MYSHCPKSFATIAKPPYHYNHHIDLILSARTMILHDLPSPLRALRRAVCQEIVLKDGKVRHRGIHQGGKRVIAVFGNDNITSPRSVFSERVCLYITDAFVDGERHTIPRNDGIKDDVRIGKFAIHIVECFDELIFPSTRSKVVGNIVHMNLRVRHPGGSGHVRCLMGRN